MKLLLDFNGTQLAGNNLQHIISAMGANVSVRINTAQSIPSAALAAILQSAGSKNIAIDFNGGQLSGYDLRHVVASGGANSSFSVETAQATDTATLIAAFQAAEGREISISFNGTQLQGNNVQTLLGAAGSEASVSLADAQAVPIDTLLSIINSAGGKNLSADFTGDRLVPANLQRAVAAAGTNTRISIDTAQAIPIATLLAVIGVAGSKKLAVILMARNFTPATYIW